MKKDGYISGIVVQRIQGGEIYRVYYEDIMITSDGIHYLRDNSVMNKIAESLPIFGSIASLFIR
ncbi:MAG: YjcQ family protein [Solobacterium sp.]|jgi:hypothetical protein|nr:YjcQ family protein [Solobacterium sp.]